MGEIPPFAVSVKYPRQGQVVVSVSGELDLPNSARLGPPLLEAVAHPVTVLDMSECDFCDSSGLRTILNAARRAREAGNSFHVAGVTVNVLRVMELAEVGSHLDLAPTVEAALNTATRR